MKRFLVPAIGIVFVLGLATTILLVMIARPWGGSDKGWRTHLNLTDEVLVDYSRSVQTFVGAEAPIEVWHTRQDKLGDDQAFYVGKGCAYCHGIDGQGGVTAPAFRELARSDIRKALRSGPAGMPPLSEEAAVLTETEVDAIVAYIEVLQANALAAQPVISRPVLPTAPLVVATISPKPVATTAPVASGTAEPTPEPPVPSEPVEDGPITLAASTADITIDGDVSDWKNVAPVTVRLQQIKSFPGADFDPVEPVDADLRVSVSGDHLYVLVEVPDDYDYLAEDHGLSAALAVMFRIDELAPPHMGATEEDQKRSLGKVDIWHWELDCGPYEVSGGISGKRGGNDPACNLDDEYANRPEDLEDDGTPQAENSLKGVWDHTSKAQGDGAEGTWIFEISRPLQTGDPDDAQFAAGSTARMALAYWDPDESVDGWSNAGHLQSSSGGWIEVNLP